MPEDLYAFSIFAHLPRGVRFGVDSHSIDFANIGGIHSVQLKGRGENEKINDASVIVFTCDSSLSESDVQSLAVDVKNRIKLASIKANIGLNCGDDIPTGGLSTYAINLMSQNNNVQIINERIGIAIYRNDIPVSFHSMQIDAEVTKQIDDFKGYIEENTYPFYHISERQSIAMDFLNYSHHEKNMWASFFCIMLAIEVLFKQGRKSDAICQYADTILERINGDEISSSIKSEALTYIANMKQESVIKSCTSWIERLCDSETAQKFRTLYSIRSSIAHGRIPPNRHIAELSEAYDIAKRVLCASIVSEEYRSANS